MFSMEIFIEKLEALFKLNRNKLHILFKVKYKDVYNAGDHSNISIKNQTFSDVLSCIKDHWYLENVYLPTNCVFFYLGCCLN